MKKYSFIYAAAALAMLASCDEKKDEPTPEPIPGEVYTEVVVDAQVGYNSLFSRSTPTGTDPKLESVFNTGDRIAVTDGTTADFYGKTDDGWKAEGTGHEWSAFPVTFEAHYPADASMTAFKLPADQSDASKIIAADYMTAHREVGAMPLKGILILDFERQLARVEVHVTGVDAAYGKAIESLSVNSTSGAIPADNALTAVRTCKAGDAYYALVVPGAAQATSPFITVKTASGKEFQTTGIPEIVAGKSYRYDLYVGSDGITLSAPIVSDWTSGGTLSGTLTDITDVEEDGLYFSVSGSGSKDASSRENAGDLKALLDVLYGSRDLSEMVVYMAEGIYEFPTGTKFQDRHIKSVRGEGVGKTFIRPADTNSSDKVISYISGTTSIVFENITFDGCHDRNTAGNYRLFYIEHESNTEFVDCVIENFNNSANAERGSALYIANGDVKCRRTVFRNNFTDSRGTVAHYAETPGSIFMADACTFVDNGLNGPWGISYQGGGNSSAAFNNTVFINGVSADEWNRYEINTDGDLILVSCSFFHSADKQSHKAFIRANERHRRVLINNLFHSQNGFPSFRHEKNSADAPLSLGHNFWQSAEDWNFGERDMQYTDDLGAYLDADNNLVWNVPATYTDYATLAEIKRAVNDAPVTNRPGFNSIFSSWVSNGFGVDRMGNRRNTTKMRPGAYDK